jgi:cysteine-rich repeat protein
VLTFPNKQFGAMAVMVLATVFAMGGACTEESSETTCPDGTVCPALFQCHADLNGDYSCVVETCGDGLVDPLEECDDGDDNSDTAPDACRTNCVLPSCGDAVVDSGETCDDGNDTEDDACPSGPSGSCQSAICGDGFIQTGVEECDDGNNNPQDACPTGPTGTCETAVCGDGFIQLGVEVCDCGTDPSNLPSGCASVNSDDIGGACREDCTISICGDGIVDPGEECDDGVQNSDFYPDACRSNCLDPFCGDSVLDTGETCDCGLDTNNLPPGCNDINNDTVPAPCAANCTEP